MSKDDYGYDGAVVFRTPIRIRDDHDEVITIYGLLYHQKDKHKDDLWSWAINRYICYLQGCERVQQKGCKLAKGLIITTTDNIIPLNYRHKNLIYRIIKKDMVAYRLIEPEKHFIYGQDEVEDIFIISKEFINRIQNSSKKI